MLTETMKKLFESCGMTERAAKFYERLLLRIASAMKMTVHDSNESLGISKTPVEPLCGEGLRWQ